MPRRFLLSILLMTFAASAAGHDQGTAAQTPGRTAEVSLLYKARRGRYDTPYTNVFLLVGGRRVLVRSNAVGEFRTLERAEYGERKIPAEAVAAGTGWWAGQGEDIYVIRRGQRLVVFVRDLDESGGDSAYRQWKVVRLPRR